MQTLRINMASGLSSLIFLQSQKLKRNPVRLHFRVETLLRDVHSLEPASNLLYHLGNFLENVEVKVSVSAPHPLI